MMTSTVPARTRKRGSWNNSFTCDQIQNPHGNKFDSTTLLWVGSKQSAWIAKSRLGDFIQGEEGRMNFNTAFRKQQRRDFKNETMSVIEKVYYWYHCTFVPQDFCHKLSANDILPNTRILDSGQIYLWSTTLTGIVVSTPQIVHKLWDSGL